MTISSPATGSRPVRTTSAGVGPRPVDQAVVVVGAKGGVGASSVALAIARDLSRSATAGGTTTLLVDAHLGRNDIEVLSRGETASPPGFARTTARALGVEAEPRDAASARVFARRVVESARRWTDDDGGWVVVDAGVASGAWQRELVAQAERPLLVTTPDELSIVNAYTAMKRLGPAAERAAILVNHAADASAAQHAHTRLASACERFLSAKPPLVGWLPTLTEYPAGAVIERPPVAA